MAPSAVETITVSTAAVTLKSAALIDDSRDFSPISYNHETEEKGETPATYPHYLPTWEYHEAFPPLEPFEHHDHGKDADPTYPDLLPRGGCVTVKALTPTIGSEVHGIQLSSLSDAGKDQLARFVAERKVVAFRAQDLADRPIEEALNLGRYFGRLHIHPTSGAPAGHPEIHLVHRPVGDTSTATLLAERTSSVAWHSDVSYEQQPPGTTFLYVLDQPASGGDTLFVDAVEAYRRLSPSLRQRLHGLYATHSGIEQVQRSISRGSIQRRVPVVNTHPIVRTHPVTGEKSLYINEQFTRTVVGFKKEESDALLRFLYNHLALGADFQARIRWEPGTVVVWDNRVTQHTALLDWMDGGRRHLARLTPQAERPFQTPYKEEEEAA